jgi:hypothetical protein
MPSTKKIFPDLIASLFLLASTLYYAFNHMDFSIPPFEDAAMIMRYAQHLAGGHGIVWNIGEHPWMAPPTSSSWSPPPRSSNSALPSGRPCAASPSHRTCSLFSSSTGRTAASTTAASPSLF